MSGPVDEGYFNDLSRQPGKESPIHESTSAISHTDQSELPKTKRIACVICRKRKLKCDGNRPKCATCARLGHTCGYDEARRKSGPKRGYVKELEARLAQVETQLQGNPAANGRPKPPSRHPSIPEGNEMDEDPVNFAMPSLSATTTQQDTFVNHSPFSASNSNPLPEAIHNSNNDFAPDMNFDLGDNFSWEMIGLGVEEPLPTQEAMDELNHTFFEKVYPSLPIVHKYRYYAGLNLAPLARPPVALRYSMWALAAMVMDKYSQHDDIFYRRARKYLELDEMKGVGEHFVTLAHAQAWILVATYEFKLMYFPRAWMSVGRAARQALMMGLHRMDGIGFDIKQCLPPPKDWTEREERRRTFWMAYCIDRYASIGTGWPMAIDEKDILTNLPASEEAFANGVPQETPAIKKCLTHQEISELSAFAAVVYVTHFFGLNLTHLHRPEEDEDDANLQGTFWKRHRTLDNVLSNLLLALPPHLRLPAGMREPKVVFVNFSAHTSTICLHQAAIYKAQRNNLPQSITDASRARCLSSAAEVVNIMRMTSHLDIATMNPYLVFCLYVAARVLVQHIKAHRDDIEVKTSLEFLLTAMAALRRKVPLAESFMIQLQLDIEGSGLDVYLHYPEFTMLLRENAHKHDALCSKHQTLRAECASHKLQKDHSKNPISVDFQIYDAVNSNNNSSGASPAPTNQGTTSPQSTSYSLHNLDLKARNNALTNPYNVQNPNPNPEGICGILPGEASWGWSTNDSTMQAAQEAGGINNPNDPTPIGLNPIVNNGIATSINAFANDMSDMSNDLSRHNSTGLTPQSTQSLYAPSSNTSYSPPTVQDDDPLTSTSAVSGAAAKPTSLNNITAAPASNMNDRFEIPKGWGRDDQAGGNAATTGPDDDLSGFGHTGLTPGPGEWESMMQGMQWQGETGMTPK